MAVERRRILVVDADLPVRAAVGDVLRDAGFTTREASTAREATHALETFRPDLVVLDVVLPEIDGFDLARWLGDEIPGTPVIFLTTRQATPDKLVGLALGDDYVTKPCDPDELVARVRAVLRRTHGGDEGVLRFADVTLNERNHEVRRPGNAVELTPREFNLLRFFLLNPNRVLSKDQILANVWEDHARTEASTVETYVSYLRRKLDRFGPPLIQTVRLVGYALRDVSASG